MDSEFNKECSTVLICKRIKNIYFPEKEWVDSYLDTSNKFSSLIENMDIFYPEMDEESKLEKSLGMNDNNLKDMIDFVKESST